MNLEAIRNDLSFLSDKEVVLFGSFVTGECGPRSDIDVAIIARSHEGSKVHNIRIEAVGRAPECYDIQVFEALPLVLKGSIIENYEVLFGDPLEIGMYFYRVRKAWEDYMHRVEIPTVEEIRRGLSSG